MGILIRLQIPFRAHRMATQLQRIERYRDLNGSDIRAAETMLILQQQNRGSGAIRVVLQVESGSCMCK